MRRCVTLVFVLLLVLVIKPGIEMLLNSATANDGSRISNDKRVHGDACRGLGSIRVPRVGRYVPRRRTFLFVSLFVRSSCCRDNSTGTRDGRAPQKIASFTAQSGQSAYRYENRCDHANGTRDYLAWWSVLRRPFHPSQSHPKNCSERS